MPFGLRKRLFWVSFLILWRWQLRYQNTGKTDYWSFYKAQYNANQWINSVYKNYWGNFEVWHLLYQVVTVVFRSCKTPYPVEIQRFSHSRFASTIA